jgi:DNA-directed RNA polymerase specialized sigma24 family protein
VPDVDAMNSPHRWQDWFDRHQAAILLFARQFLASVPDAEDAVQQGFIQFWKSQANAPDLYGPTPTTSS